MKRIKTGDVFGITRDLPLNYVERDSADKVLVENLTRDKHLVIFGSSKQGKTSLRKHSLNDDDYIVIHCSNKWGIGDINTAILKKAVLNYLYHLLNPRLENLKYLQRLRLEYSVVVLKAVLNRKKPEQIKLQQPR